PQPTTQAPEPATQEQTSEAPADDGTNGQNGGQNASPNGQGNGQSDETGPNSSNVESASGEITSSPTIGAGNAA
ncbi:MAG: hypothetical protein L0J95_13285, partial [Yaniella sp.]|nr:hypothetical protein [Yaniella sp.]